MSGPLSLPADPTAALQAATKQYVDNKPGVAITRRVYQSSTTWTKPAGLKYLEVEVLGGGGASSTTTATGASQYAAGGGGGGGCYQKLLVDAASLGATVTVTVGAGGFSNGAAGGNTTFGTVLTANGGSPGTGTGVLASNGGVGTSFQGTGGGAPTQPTGVVTILGSNGAQGCVVGAVAMGGMGGGSFFCAATPGAIAATSPTTGFGARGYGGGGAGGAAAVSAGAQGVGAGMVGQIIVTEYL